MKNPKDSIDMFIDFYTQKNVDNINTMMSLFSKKTDIELVGIGATKPSEYEWYRGHETVKEIVLSDWNNWGNVLFHTDLLQLNQQGNVAWFSLPCGLENVDMNEKTWEFFLSQMKELIDKKDQSAHDKMFEAAHYGMRRVREKNLGVGHYFNMVITGVLLYEDDMWKFHTLHWSMPVE